MIGAAQIVNSVGPLVVSVIVLAVWVAHHAGLGISLTDADAKLMDTVVVLVLGYWLGSSHGSERKTELMTAKTE